MADPKGESVKVGFDGSIRLEFHGAKVTSDAGLLAYRDLDEALGLFDSVPFVFHDSRTGRNIQHDITALLRQSVYSRLAGYEDVNDADRLSVDPTMRRITGKKIDRKNAASANTMGRFETQMLSVQDNLKALSKVNGRWVEGAQRTFRSPGENLSSTHHFGYGQFSKSCPWRARSLCVQRTFRIHLLPSPVLFQPVRRLRRLNASARQCSQRGSLEGATGTNRGSVREEKSSQILPW